MIPRLTRWVMWHLPADDSTGDRAVVIVCVLVIALYAFGVIK